MFPDFLIPITGKFVLIADILTYYIALGGEKTTQTEAFWNYFSDENEINS
jgi:hypothetical protein